MESVVCKICGEKNNTNFTSCSNCGTDLSYDKESPDSTQTKLTTVLLTGSSSAQRMIELVVNISYIVFTLGLLVIILSATLEMCTHQGFLLLLPSPIVYFVVPHFFESTHETMFLLIFGLCLLTWLSVMRYGWMIQKLDHDKSNTLSINLFANQKLNTFFNVILTSLIIGIFFFGSFMFYFILGLGLSILITFYLIVWGNSETFRNFDSDVRSKWSNSNIRMILRPFENAVKIIITIGVFILILVIILLRYNIL